MLKLIVGLKGTGKTKALIDMVNQTLDTTQGSVVCIEKGNKLIYDIKYQARLINTDQYHVQDAKTLFGFIAGICASDHDLTDLFIDSALKICRNDAAAFEEFVSSTAELADKHGFNCIITASIAPEDVPKSLKKYVQ